MAYTAQHYRALTGSEGAALMDRLVRVPADGWTAPTACAGWDALDVLIHLRLGLGLYPALIRNGLAGRHEPPWELPPDVKPSEEFKRLHREMRATDPGAIVAGVRDAYYAYLSALADVDDASLDRPVWFYGLPATLRNPLEARLFDTILHGADIARAVGLDPWFTAEGARFAGDFATRQAATFFDPARLEGVAGSVGQTIDGVSSRAEIGDRQIRIGPADGSEPATFSADGGTWALVTWGRLDAAEAEARGLLRVDGDRALVKRYLGALRTP